MTTSEKTCFKCLCQKPLTDFYKHARMADGHINKCKECTKNDVTQHRNKNIDRFREYDRNRAMLSNRVTARAEYAKTDAGKASRKKSIKKYLREKPENRTANLKKYYQKHKEKCIERSKNYTRNNIERIRAVKLIAQRFRELKRKQRSPSWLTDSDKAAIKTKYLEASWMTRRSGIKHHVDHIVPLQGEFVSGLHVPWNLRVIPGRENILKKNHHDSTKTIF